MAVGAAALALQSPALAIAGSILLVFGLIAVADLRYGTVALILIAPWMTLGNVLAGERWVALGADALLMLLTVGAAAVMNGRTMDRGSRVIGWVLFATLAIGALQMANPRGLSLLGDLEGYRAFFLPLLGIPIGYAMSRADPQFSGVLLRGVVASSLVVAVMGIRQAMAPGAIDWAIIESAQSDFLPFTITGTRRLRAFSPLPGPFHYGLMMSMALTVTVALALFRPRAWQAAAIGVVIAGLALNATRLNWAGAAVALVVVVIASLSSDRIVRWFPRLIALTVIASVTVWGVMRLAVLSPIRTFAGEFLADPLANTSYVYRILGWVTDIIPAIQSAPLVGYGTGMAKDGLGPFTSHNVLLKLLIEGGAILLIAYGILIALILLALWRTRSTSVPARAGIAMILGAHAAGMFGPLLDAYPANVYLWLVLGGALSDAERPSPSIPK